jgi:anti-anti-sigma regulatory factor
MTKRAKWEQRQGAWVVRLPVRLEADLEDSILAGLAKAFGGPTRSIVLDFSRSTYADSAAMGVLVDLLRRALERNVPVFFVETRGQPELIIERLGISRHARRADSVEKALEEAPAGDR